MNGDAKFWDRMAKRYAASPVADEASYQTKLERTRAEMAQQSRVLEVGCGTGTTSISHAPYAGQILATDISAQMIEIAQAKAKDAGVENVTFRQATLEDLNEMPESFDMVMAHSLLHLMRDMDATIRQIYELVRPGGVFVSSTTCMADDFGWIRVISPITKVLNVLPVLSVFSQADLENSIRAAGFDIEHEWKPGPKKAVFIVARKPA